MHGRFIIVFAYVVFGGGAVGPAMGQPAKVLAAEPGQRPDGGGESPSDATPADVYVNDSIEAANAIAKAEALARRGQWRESAQLLQRILESTGDRLIQTSSGRYVGIEGHITRLIAVWPAAGLEAYRLLFEHRMEEALRDGRSVPGDWHELLSLFNRYFCTASAARLADVIGPLAVESGDLALADHVYRRVLEVHPDASAYVSRYSSMLALIEAMRGGPAVELSKADPEATVRWMGQDRPLREAIKAVRDGFSAVREPTSPDDWPTLGGDDGRNRRAHAAVDDPGLLWRFSDFGTRNKKSDGRFGETPGKQNRDDGQPLGIHPVVSGGLVFAQHHREIVALHRNTGATAWRYREEGASSSESGYFLEDPPAALDAVTVYDGRVYASLPGDTTSYYSYESARTSSDLVCLKADSGRLIWRIDPRSVDEAFAEVVFDTSPIVSHDALYIVGRRRRSFGFEDCYLYRFQASKGTFEHRTHLGGGSTGAFGSRRATRTAAAMANGTIYVGSNLGTVAAVSAHDGSVRWLRLYERHRREESRRTDWFEAGRPFNSVIAAAGRVIVSPVDSDDILILDAADGRVRQSIPLRLFDGPVTLLGVREDRLCVTASSAAACYDLAGERLLWSTPLADGARLRGRGQWAGDHLLAPTSAGLSTFHAADGQQSNQSWDAEGSGGNLLAFPDQLLSAGVEGISAYVRRKDIRRTLQERMAASPNDPLPALELAETALSNGEFSLALSTLDEAVHRAEGRATALEEGLARRLFDDVLVFVDRLAERSGLDDDIADKLLTYASQYPPDASAHLTYRLRFADLFQADRPDRAMRLYHQILRDRTLRELEMSGSTKGAESAGVHAQRRIAELIDKHGSILYGPYEAEARRWLEGAKRSGDEATLARIVDTFPNSEAAPAALIAHGDLSAGQGRAQEAAVRFARAYHRYPQKVDRPALLRKIADAYEAGGMKTHAYRWLTKAAREYPSVSIDEDGKSATFLEYRERLAGVRDEVEPSRPTLTLPLDQPFVRTLDESALLLTPRFSREPGLSWSRYFVATRDAVQAFEAGSDSPVWSGKVPSGGTMELLATTPAVVVLTTPHLVFALDAATGDKIWSHGRPPGDIEDMEADWEEADAFRAHAIQGRRLISLRGSGRMTSVDLKTGELQWSRTHRPVPSEGIRLADSWIVYHVVQGERSVVCLVNAETGAWIDSFAIDEKRSIEDVFVTLDGQVIVVASQSIAAYDPGSHRRRWRTSAGGPIYRASLMVNVDALYFSSDGSHLKKLSLEDGRLLWESQRLTSRRDDYFSVELQEGSVLVRSNASVSAVDAVTGLTLWNAVTPDRPRFIAHAVTSAYAAAVDASGSLRDEESTAYFYDHRNASGLIPRDGGAVKLGRLDEVRAVLVIDGALLIQTESALHGWRHGQP